MTFTTDADIFAIGFSGLCNVEIDGHLISQGSFSASSNQYLTIDLRCQGVKRPRSVTFHTARDQANFNGVWVNRGSDVWAPGNPKKHRLAVLGDSISAGSDYSSFAAGNVLSARLGRRAGYVDAWNFSAGGTGYIASPNGRYNYLDRMAQVLDTRPDVIIIMSSLNDQHFSKGQLTDAASRILAEARKNNFLGPIVGVGLSTGATKHSSMEDAIAKAYYAAGGMNYWIPVVNSADGPWTSTNLTSPNSMTRSAYIASDSTHPTDRGVAYIAEKLACALTGVLQKGSN